MGISAYYTEEKTLKSSAEEQRYVHSVTTSQYSHYRLITESDNMQSYGEKDEIGHSVHISYHKKLTRMWNTYRMKT